MCWFFFGCSFKRIAGGKGIAVVDSEEMRCRRWFKTNLVMFFLEPWPIDEAEVHTAQFRTLANQNPELSAKLKTLIERVEKQREVYLSLCEDLSNTERTWFSTPDLPKKNPCEAARTVRQWLGLSDQNSFDTYREAVEARGILVFLSNGYNGKWQIAKENPIIGFSGQGEQLSRQPENQ